MNQDQVKEKLLKLHDCEIDFTVVFTGKKSPKVNGLYKPEKNEILIHNRNFAADKAGDNLLIYTAIHEMAHHIQFTERKQKSAKAHTQLFYSILDDLVDNAEKKKIYNIGIGAETQKLIDEVRDISCQIAELQRKLGKVLIQLEERCNEQGIRFEDVIERKAQVSRKTVKQSIKAHNLGISGKIGADIQEAVIKERDEDKQREMLLAAGEGKSVDQVKVSAAAPVNHDDETVSLVIEKRRLERTIESLKRRLDEVEEHLKSKGEL
jgi:hypothetical protein